jgi:uncharacterized cupin superfamily protein
MDANGLVQWAEVPGRKVEVGPMCATWTDLGKAGGSVSTGLKRIQIAPGRRSTPVHVHDLEEEIFYVMDGDGLSWQDGETCAVAAGDCIVHAAGGPAHTLIAGDEGLDVLAFGTRRAAAVARLPRAGVAWLGRSWVEIGDEPHPWACWWSPNPARDRPISCRSTMRTKWRWSTAIPIVASASSAVPADLATPASTTS